MKHGALDAPLTSLLDNFVFKAFSIRFNLIKYKK